MLNQLNLEDSWKHMNKKAAPGVDRQSAMDYERALSRNIGNLVWRLKQKRYKAGLVKRVNIPKPDGKLRPLGLPVVEDKLVQTVAARILEAIFEQDFLSSSYGYRPNIGAHDCVREISKTLQFGRYEYIVEADIKGYFDNIDHDWLLKMIEQRVDDRALLELIRKWLKAGILDTDGMTLHPVFGTPQGGVISPILANIYLHYALDIWFEKIVKPRCRGKAYLCRYADDFICAFEYIEDAENFYRTLSKRLGKFGLELAKEKSNIIPFGRFYVKRSSFDFLGFEYFWGKSRKGVYLLKRRTSRKKFRRSLKDLTDWVKGNRHKRLWQFFRLLNMKLRGYYNYYGVIGNYESLQEFYYHAERILFKWLNRRSQKKSFRWETFSNVLKFYEILKPYISEPRVKREQILFEH